MRMRSAEATRSIADLTDCSGLNWPACIPPRYGAGMSTQMTVRLSDQATEYVDRKIAEGPFASRAEFLSWLAEREAAQERDRAELMRLRADGQLGSELLSFHERNAARPRPHLDDPSARQ